MEPEHCPVVIVMVVMVVAMYRMHVQRMQMMTVVMMQMWVMMVMFRHVHGDPTRHLYFDFSEARAAWASMDADEFLDTRRI